jgi:hypothetical protein
MQTLRRATIAQVRAGRGGRLIEIDNDVFNLAKRLHEIDRSLGLDWNDAGGYFRVTQTLEGGRKHVVLTCAELTPAVIDRVREVVNPGYDLVGELDRKDRDGQRERERRLSEETGILGERLHYAIRKDLDAKDRIFLPRGVNAG